MHATNCTFVFLLHLQNFPLLFEFTTGIDFYIGLPEELNYRVARYYTYGNDLDGVMCVIKSMADPINRQLMWTSMTGQNKLDKVIENARDIFDVSKTG